MKLNNTKIFQILPNDINIILEALDYGIDDYLIKDSYNSNDLLCRVSRLLNFHVHTNIYVNNFTNIYLNQDRRELYFKNCKIKLSKNECTFLNYLIENQGFGNKDKIISYIKVQTGCEYSAKALVMMVSRLKKKINYITGYNLIKSKYSSGYYIC